MNPICYDLESSLFRNNEIKAFYFRLFTLFGSIILFSKKYRTNFLLLAFAAICKQESPVSKS